MGFHDRHLIEGPAGTIEVATAGSGAPVVLLPSLGRGADDFADLAAALAAGGHRAVAPEPRGIGRSDGPLEGIGMDDLAADVAAVIASVGAGPVPVVGHAFGNRVARMTATRHPELVDRLALLACGGHVPPAPEIARALLTVFDETVSDDEHRAAVQHAFFAPGNDPTPWLDGWHPTVAAAQGAATQGTPSTVWWAGGGKQILVLQPADDVLAVPANAVALAEEFGDRVEVVVITGAGHALLPEQPDVVATTLLHWLG